MLRIEQICCGCHRERPDKHGILRQPRAGLLYSAVPGTGVSVGAKRGGMSAM